MDNLVHFGAGYCSELDNYMLLKPQRILLVEGDSEIATALLERTANFPQVVVKNSVVSGEEGEAIFNRYNLPGTGGLHEAAALLQIYPGLRKTGEFPVKTVTPSNLLDALSLGSETNNQLIIDLPGEELPVLKELAQSGKLHQFKTVHLYCGEQPMYEMAKAAPVIMDWLQDHGYDFVEKNENQNQDCPCWVLRRNSLQLKYRVLKKQMEKKEIAFDEQAFLFNERQVQIAQMSKKLDEETKLANNSLAQIEQLTIIKDEQFKLANDRLNQIELLNKVKEEQAQYIAELTEKIESLTKELDAAEQRLSDYNQKQPLIDNEFVKAEAQIELIKDILIREKAF